MRFLISLLLGLAGLTLAAAAPHDWHDTVEQTKAGTYLIGNPAAKVRMTEFLSYTCPHCGHFVRDSKAVLHDRFVADGSVRIQVVNAARDPLDLVATMLVRCTGPRKFWPASSAVFAAQSDWVERGSGYQQRWGQRLEFMSGAEQRQTLGRQSGLYDIVAPFGLTAAAADVCVADETQAELLAQMSASAFQKITGTPSISINGAPPVSIDWAATEPKLRAAGAR